MYLRIRTIAVLLLSLLLAVPLGNQPVAAQTQAQIVCVPAPAGLVSWWTGDGTANDLQNINNGTLQNGATFTAGKVGQAFSFDGVDDYVDVPGSLSLPYGNAPRTLELWIQTTSSVWVGNRYTIFEYGTSFLRQAFGLDMDVYPDIQFYAWSDDLYFDTGAPQAGWMHLAVSYDGNVTAKAYVNGVLRGTKIFGGQLDTGFTDLNIGRAVLPGPNYHFQGPVDEVTIYNRELSASEIQSIFNAGSAGKCKPSIFVASIDPSYTPVGGSFNVTGSVTIHDTNGSPVPAATVTLRVVEPNRNKLAFVLTTDSNGVATNSFLSSLTGTYTFTVANVKLKGRIYDSSLNVETQDTLTIP